MKTNKPKQIQESNEEIISSNIIKLLSNNYFKSYNYKQLSLSLDIRDKKEKNEVFRIAESLVKKDILLEINTGKFKINPIYLSSDVKGASVIGTIDMKQSGKAYLLPEDKTLTDIFINPNNTNRALNGDKVKVKLFPKRRNKKPEGRVIEIIERAKNQFVGSIEIGTKVSFFIPDNISMPIDILILNEDLHSAKQGDKVIVRITDWPEATKNPFGEVVELLGRPGDNDVEMKSILAGLEFALSFPKNVEDEAQKISEKISQKEISNRRDLRDVFTITIDPYDAKDFDDAISLQKLENGNYEVGVHIADVSHYVTPNSLIDTEAYNRGTSIYLVDRTISMLPEKLSNFVCSLRPDEEKLCFSAMFELNKDAKILNEWFGKTVIKSNKRFNYDEVQEIIEKQEGEYAKEILIFDEIAKKLREERFEKGAINFEKSEVKFKLDENSKPIGVYIKEMKDSNKLIEDFMLLANRKVAEFINNKFKEKKPFVYRVHDKPNEEKLESFSTFLKKLGYQLQLGSRKKLSNSYNTLFKDINGKAEKEMIETIAIRTMAKAFYTTKNIGHYGLGFQYYTHFTSPIRRYPDLLVHRLLNSYLNEQVYENEQALEEKCKHASKMESKAAEAERTSVKYKQTEYMLDKIGKVFEGAISGVTKWGLFVLIQETQCEGLISIHSLKDDYYTLDEDNYRLIGTRTKKVFRLGDKLNVRVNKVDLSKKQIDYEYVE